MINIITIRLSNLILHKVTTSYHTFFFYKHKLIGVLFCNTELLITNKCPDTIKKQLLDKYIKSKG